MDASMENALAHFRNAQKQLCAGERLAARTEFLLASLELFQLAAAATDPSEKRRLLERAQRLNGIAERITPSEKVDSPTASKSVTPSLRDGSDDETKEQPDASRWKLTKVPEISFDDIAGLADVKSLIRRRVIDPIRNPELARVYSRKVGGGVMMYGPPGTGKTMIAKAIANELRAPFFEVKSSEIMSKWVGEAEQNVRDLFAAAREKTPSVLFFDEAEALLAKRGSNSTVMNRVVPEFLAQVDGVAGGSEGMLLIGATNRPWDIDSAAMRAGRFGEHIYIQLPDADARRYLLRKKLDKIPGSNRLDFDVITQQTNGYSGADISELLVGRILDPVFDRAIETGQVADIEPSDVEAALRSTRPSVSETELRRFDRFRNTGE